MLDAEDADACGACHEGGGARRTAVTHSAPTAPACATCHSGPAAAFDCSTCHGSGRVAYPPRDPCFFPGAGLERVHRTHAEPSASRVSGFACSTCHPQPLEGRPNGVHANGYTEVWFDPSIAGREARFDSGGKSCEGTCHARGGSRPVPTWADRPIASCNECHASPPRDHYAGPCTNCHHEANADGTKLTAPTLHLNGRVDLGDGSGRCGACHGTGDDPWPSSGAHRVHAQPTSARPVACETCHAVPGGGDRHPEGVAATVRFSGLATRGGRRPTYDPSSKTCLGSYCHDGEGATVPSPRWDAKASGGCSSCHGGPPPPPHAQASSCGGATCHEGMTAGVTITAEGRRLHVNGLIDRRAP